MSRTRFYLLPMLMLLFSCSEQEPVMDMGRVHNCDVSQASCTLDNAGVQATLSLGPDVTPLKPFPARLHIEGVTVSPASVVIDFQMSGMEMGMNRYRMMQEGGGWVARATLPVCTAARMDWIAQVEFRDQGGQRFIARYPFHTSAN